MEMKDGEIQSVQGSSGVYTIKRIGEVYSCSCPAWKNQSLALNARTCKHLRRYLTDEHESARIGGSLTMRAPKTKEGGKVQAVPPALLLANKWTPDIDPTGWWMSEKLDGVRAWWNGKEFISRLGNKFDPPAWFTKSMGTQQLDGELWMGRKMFQKAISVVRSQGLDKEWKAVKYLVFDIPDMKAPFEKRYEAMLTLKLPEHCTIVPQIKCAGVEQLKESLKAYELLGAEGLMLRKPCSMYEGRRSSTLLKVKTFYDAEAVITGFVAGKGRHEGRLGAYECKMANGKTFSCGTGLSDKDRNSPLKVGTKITYRCVELTDDGIPRFPVYVGEAIDK